MNLIWTPKSGNKGNVQLYGEAVARVLIAKGLAIDLDNEVKVETPVVIEKVEAKVAIPVKKVPIKKVQTKKKINK